MAADVRSGIPADQLKPVAWRKSSYSGKEGNCVELALLPGDTTALRDSHDPRGPALAYPGHRVTAFLLAAKDGRFDVHDG